VLGTRPWPPKRPAAGPPAIGEVARIAGTPESYISAGTALAIREDMIALVRLALTDLWFRAIDAHDARPLTRAAALAAVAVEHEDRRRRGAGIPSIFDLPRRGSTGRGLR
jgi:hypothetical protein